jgi:glycosyltransferase involved in cell wall biosynthesis
MMTASLKGTKLTAGNEDKIRHVVCIPVKPGEEQAFLHTFSCVLNQNVIAAPVLVVDMTCEEGKVPDLIRSASISSSNGHNDVFIEKVSHCKHDNELACALSICCHGKFSAYDFLFVKPGIELAYAWDARLGKVAYSDPIVAAVSPMCDSSPLFSLLDFQTLPATKQYITDDVDRMAYCLGNRVYYEIPSFFEGCFYMRADALKEINDLDELLATGKGLLGTCLAKRIRAAGRLNVICDHLYVGRFNNDSRIETGQTNVNDLDDVENAIVDGHPLTYLRYAVGENIRKEGYFSSMPGLEPKPVQLHIMHSWGGGIEKWVRDYTSAAKDSINMVLKSVGSSRAFGHKLSLFTGISDTYPVRTWDLSIPIYSSSIVHLEYQHIIQQIIREFSIDAVLVSSLVGHSLDALNTGKKTIIVCHDYYPFCPAINMYSNGICSTCDEQRLNRCISENRSDLIKGDPTISDEGWMTLRDRYLQLIESRLITMIAPTNSVKRNMSALDSRFAQADFIIIPHGLFIEKHDLRPAITSKHQKMRAVVLGQLKPVKGLDLLREALPGLCELIDIYLVGCGEASAILDDDSCIRIIEKYDYGDLPRILEEISPDFGLLLSVWPETFSYTLSELMVFGIPPVVTSLGSFTDRVRNGVNGFLFEPNKEALVESVQALVNKPEKLEAVRKNLSGYSHRSLKEMVDDYSRLLQLGKVEAARYELCIGTDIGLTKSYIRLYKSYNKLIKAYERTHQAYEQRTNGYNQLKQAFEQLQKAYTSKESSLEEVWGELQRTREEIQRIHDSFYWKVGQRTQKVGRLVRGIMEKK